MQGLSVSKLKSTEIFSLFFFFLLTKKKSISNYLGKSEGSQPKIKPDSGHTCMLRSCCAKASFLRPCSHFRHICLGAGTPAVLLPPALTDPGPGGRGSHVVGPQAHLSSPPMPHACCRGGLRPQDQKAHSPLERPPAFRSPHRGSRFALGAELGKGGKIRPSLGPTKPHTSLWAT